MSNRHALILIDFQNDFLSADGRMPVAQTHVAPALAAAAHAVAAARGRGDVIIAVGNEFRADDWFMNLLRRRAAIAGSAGAAWCERLPLEAIAYFPKWAGSAFVNPDFEACLKHHHVTALTLTGVYARACVTATARDALARGYTVDLLAGAIACASDATRRRALARLARRGARVIENAELLSHDHLAPGEIQLSIPDAGAVFPQGPAQKIEQQPDSPRRFQMLVHHQPHLPRERDLSKQKPDRFGRARGDAGLPTVNADTGAQGRQQPRDQGMKPLSVNVVIISS
jgi:nicotinamidase-related amidase